jgi:hypothetical protein
LVRAPPCHGGGCGFEPRRLRFFSLVQTCTGTKQTTKNLPSEAKRMRDSTCCNASANYPRFQTAGESFVNAFGTRTILNRAIPNASPIFDRLGFENDVRYENDDDFKEGRNFQIVELNGATSEATSIYDARNSVSSAYRTLFRQWRLVFAIGARNRASGHAPSSLATLWCRWRQYSAVALSYPLAD